MTEREARIAAIRERWRKATTDGPANEFLGEAWNDIPWLLAHLQAAERDRDAARERLAEALDALVWCSGSDDFAPGGKAREGFEKIVLPLITTPTPPPEEDAR